jgi:predicted RNA-binding protein YlxR (DUF448 family)
VPHEPERTCVGCRRKASKRDLLRIGAGANGFQLDPDGSLPGRGAYLHGSTECAAVALERGALARALRASIRAGEASNLLRDIEGVIEKR